MKHMKRIIALLLTCMMILGLAACGTTEEIPQTTTQTTASQPSVPETNAPETEAEDEDLAEIVVYFWTQNTLPADEEMVEDAINEITAEKINTVIDLFIVETGSYVQQLNLMLSANEKLDLMVTLPGDSAHFNSMSSQNQLTDLTDLLPEYAPDLLEVVPESWFSGTTVDGKVLSVTSMGDKVTPLAFVCRTDILEQTGIDPATVKTADDVEALLAKAKEVAPDVTPLAVGTKKILTTPYLIDAEGNFVKFDNLGEGDNALIGILNESGTVENNYARDIYISTSERFKDWYEKGYVYKDGANNAENAETIISANAGFGCFKLCAAGAEASLAIACGHEMTVIYLDDAPQLATNSMRKFTWAVPVTATEPEAAVKFMNLIYSDAEVLNLLTWGIEGVHYQTLEDGTIDFLEGQDASNCGYYLGDCSAIFGNGFLAKVRKGQSPSLRDEAYALNVSAYVSPYTGFSYTTTGYENQVAAITSTIEEYRPSFACGLYTEEYYNEFMQKLEANGAQEYIAHIQEELDAWLANK